VDRQFLREPLLGIDIHDSLRKRLRRFLQAFGF